MLQVISTLSSIRTEQGLKSPSRHLGCVTHTTIDIHKTTTRNNPTLLREVKDLTTLVDTEPQIKTVYEEGVDNSTNKKEKYDIYIT